MNVITPMKRWKSPILKLAFHVLSAKSKQRKLRTLSFIHFARWTCISPDDWPKFTGMHTHEYLKRDYLLFESNFNGSWNEYVDAFHTVLARSLNIVWWWSDKFPGSVPLEPFKKYIQHNQILTDWYYVAYPGSTVSDVKNALCALEALKDLEADLDAPDQNFDEKYLAFLGRTQNKLAPNVSPGKEMS